MKIDAEREQDRLTLKVKGRLDTTTSPKLEEALYENNLEEITSLTLNFAELEYVSSAGLRVLLAAHKKMVAKDGCMVVRKANKEVQEVFTITGFSEILTIE